MYMLYVCGYAVACAVSMVWLLATMDLLGCEIIYGGYSYVAYMATV
mgnify:CR=1 FL=1|jgi:hypothetical protein